ncbi:hypothetical protein ACFL2J_02700 [Candidatus Omnitrophota bacterium]
MQNIRNIMNADRKTKLIWIINYIVIPVIMIIILYDSNFMHGLIDHFEAGKEVVCVNELFQGKLLYKDTLPYFGPLSTYLQSFFMFLFGKNLLVLRGFFYFGTIFTLLVGYFMACRLCQRKFFAYIAALLLIVETYHPFWATRWGGLRFGLGLLAIWCLIIFFEKKKNIWLFFSGVFSSITFLVTLDTGVLSFASIGLTLSFCIFYSYLQSKRLNFRILVFFVCGALTILIPFLVYFILIKSLIPYFNTILTIAINHPKVWSGGQGLPDFRELFHFTHLYTMGFKQVIPVLLYLFSGIYLIHRVFKKTMSWKDHGIMVLSIYGLLMYIASSRALQGPQFQMGLQPFIILWFVFLDKVFQRISDFYKQRSWDIFDFKYIAILVIFLLMISYSLISEKRFYGTFKNWFLYQEHKEDVMPMYLNFVPLYTFDSRLLNIPRAKGIRVPSEQAEEMERVTEYIISVTKPGEPVFAFPEHSIYNFLADRPCIDRFGIPGVAWTTEEWREELLVDLKKVNPRYIIYGTRLSIMAKCINRKEELLPDVISYIRMHYHKEVSFGAIAILKRNKF